MRNPLHSICPYFAMFPESFVQRQLLAYSRPGDKVLDPFCGRGTTILEGLLNDRITLGSDINPVAACIAGAKANLPPLREILSRIDELESEFLNSSALTPPDQEFFSLCYHELTLQQVVFLRQTLAWQKDRVDRLIAAMILWRSSRRVPQAIELCLSNRMPRTISTKPEYSIRWWRARDLHPPKRDAFAIAKKMALFRYAGEIPKRKGHVVLGDSRRASQLFPKHKGTVSLVVTSPPYLDTTDYAEDQWLRLWFLGGADRPQARLYKDDRHTRPDLYWKFLTEVWSGVSSLLNTEAYIVVRIGGTMLEKDDLLAGVALSLRNGLLGRSVRRLHNGETSIILRRQTNSFRPGTSQEKMEHDFSFCVTKL